MMKAISKCLWMSTVLCSLYSATALADYYQLYSPRVEKGEVSVEAKLNYSIDHRSDKDKYFSQVYGIEYGVNDYWSTELAAEIEQDRETDTKMTNIKWENVIAPFEPGANWLDVGFYFELEKAVDNSDPNNVEAKLLLEKEFGKWVHTANLTVERHFGPHANHDIDAGLAWRSRYRLNKLFEPSIEYYGEFGNVRDIQGYRSQEHIIGPVVIGKLGHIKYDAGALFGISSEARDTTVKFNLEYEF